MAMDVFKATGDGRPKYREMAPEKLVAAAVERAVAAERAKWLAAVVAHDPDPAAIEPWAARPLAPCPFGTRAELVEAVLRRIHGPQPETWKPQDMGGEWYAHGPDGWLLGPYPDADAAQRRCNQIEATVNLDRRKNAALDRAVAAGVPEAELWDAITAGDLLKYESLPCPNDTDGDGNCGRPNCPWCGKPQYGFPDRVREMVAGMAAKLAEKEAAIESEAARAVLAHFGCQPQEMTLVRPAGSGPSMRACARFLECRCPSRPRTIPAVVDLEAVGGMLTSSGGCQYRWKAGRCPRCRQVYFNAHVAAVDFTIPAEYRHLLTGEADRGHVIRIDPAPVEFTMPALDRYGPPPFRGGYHAWLQKELAAVVQSFGIPAHLANPPAEPEADTPHVVTTDDNK